mmetsp:Transcript_5496/g.13901  ORF Transcript_5496/g.13901 Transcript_5496/m.13901 type:complete len:517 (-) Transcript_5496:205-1755(-)
MALFVLFESASGYALFEGLDMDEIGQTQEAVQETIIDMARFGKVVKLKGFKPFTSAANALGEINMISDSICSEDLKNFLEMNLPKVKDAKKAKFQLGVSDPKLGNSIVEQTAIPCVCNDHIGEIVRGCRMHFTRFLKALKDGDYEKAQLGLAHSYSRAKVKFNVNRADNMIIQAIALIDTLDKDINTFVMRVREWYGWHFPEMTKIIADNMQYAKSVLLMGDRARAADHDFSGVLDEEIENDLKDAAMISMGTEISEDDLNNIKQLADQVVSLSEYRIQLYDYLKSRMNAIAPNLTVLVGELVGARLISHAGSLINLAKHPASTVQILGAEKALFRALKTKHETPKYGLIYHASLIGQAAPKFKGKISRVLAAKCALSIRVDALGETSEPTIGIESRAKVEARLRQLEGKTLGVASGVAKGKPDVKKHDKGRSSDTPALLTAPKSYNPDSDATEKKKEPKSEKKDKKKRDEEEEEGGDEKEAKKAKKEKKEGKEPKSEKKEKKSEKKEKKEKKEKA